ncbi:MAG: hypothetical protein U0575_00160 [Phycisphaerales bacterium]
MMKALFAGAATLALAAAANASFSGISWNESKVGDKCVADIYATFSTTDDVLLNIFNANVTVEGGFGSLIHNDFVGGSWAPQFSSNPAMDSFCVIGGQANFGNSTNADPNWGAAGFNQIAIPANAGWFNSNPPNLQGKAANVTLVKKDGSVNYTGAATWIMRLVFDNAPKAFSIAGGYTNNQGLGTPGVQGTFSFSQVLCIPAPGALALLGLAGLAGGRRRRA